MSVAAMRNLVIWVAWAAGAALLFGAALPLMRAGARRNDPSIAAGLFALVFTAGSCGVAVLRGTLPTIWSIDNATLVRLLASGLLTAFLILCLFTALTGGPASKVAPVVNLSSVIVLVASYFLLGTPMGLWRMCCVVLILLGTVLMESRATSKSRGGRLWMLYAALAALAYAGLTLLRQTRLSQATQAQYDIVRGAVATLLLWGFVFARGKQKHFKKMGVAAFLCPPLAAVTVCASAACTYIASLRGEMSMLAPVTLLSFVMAMLLSRLALHERQPGSAVFGTLLVLLGMFAILMGW